MNKLNNEKIQSMHHLLSVAQDAYRQNRVDGLFLLIEVRTFLEKLIKYTRKMEEGEKKQMYRKWFDELFSHFNLVDSRIDDSCMI